VPAVVALVSVALTVLVMLLGPFGSAPPVPEERPQRYILGSAALQSTSVPTLGPDGTFVVFSVLDGISRRLYRRDLSSFEMTPIPGTDDGKAPFFSPDGAWIGFMTADSVKRVPVGGGIAQTITSVGRPSAGAWGNDGMIYFTQRGGGPDGSTALARVRETGGEVEVLAELDTEAGQYESWLPEILPGGETILISVLGAGGQGIASVGPDGSIRTLVPGGFLGRYVEPGYLVYVDGASQAVVVAPFDPSSVEVTGAAIPLTEQVDGAYCFDVAADGKLVYVPLPGAGEGSEIIWIDREGNVSLALETRSTWIQPRLSPDGKQILLRKTGNECELWIADVERGSLARIVHDGDTHTPIWGPDGKRIVYHEMSEGKLVTQTVGGVRQVEVLAQGSEVGEPGSWSGGGNLFAYTRRGRETSADIWVRVMDGSSPAEPFLATEFNEQDPAISPDGKWIAYVSDETGSREVFVRSYPDNGAAWQVSNNTGRNPIWSRDGTELFFASGRKLMAVPVRPTPDGAFAAGRPEELFEGYLGSNRIRDFDVAPDGRFVSVRGAGDSEGSSELRLLLSWQQEMLRTSGGGSH
jgi:serine/threonine-protein kinase